MIKVNLIGTGRKKQVKAAGPKLSMPANFTPVLLILIVVGFAGGGYWWYLDLSSQAENLAIEKQSLDQRRVALEAVIKKDEEVEARKKKLEARKKVVDRLLSNQTSPVQVLDQLALAVERTQFVWLSNLDQRDAILNMNGTATSLNAIADFYSNLEATGYFKNIDIGQSQESGSNFTFSLKCEFAPPRPVARAQVGGN
jgi:Tfp pilus assembly protein PilN